MSIILGKIHKIARSTVRQGKSLVRFNLEQRAKELAKEVRVGRIKIDEQKAFAQFQASDVNLETAVTKISNLCPIWISDPSRGDRIKPGAKEFIRYLLKPEDMFSVPEILDVVYNESIFGAVTEYLGQVPKLVDIKVWHTVPNNSAVRSQLYHFDHRDTRQAKVFINLNNVDEGSGPLHFLPANKSKEVEDNLGYSQSDYSDEQVYNVCPADAVAKTIGPSGTCFIVDTARCLHFGSRGNERERLMLMFNFARVNCVEEGRSEVLDPIRDRLIEERYANDKVRSFSLRRN